MNIFITVEEQYIKKVSGLCGNYNQERTNDFLLPDGIFTKESYVFVNSWRLDSSVSLDKFK